MWRKWIVVIYTQEQNLILEIEQSLVTNPFFLPNSGNNSFIALGSMHAPDRVCRPKIPR